MTHAPTRRSCVEIPLSSKPRDYRPGDGPALAPVRPTLKHDTDAFIIEKRVVPGKPVNNELKLELFYVVGWPDLPGTRVAVLATKILDYVSPRTLENWEYKCSLEKDEEEERRVAAEKRKQEERAKARAASTPGTGTSTPLTPGQKRRGRPSKAEKLARRLAQQASFGENELASVPLPPARTDGPSLSTPKKKLAQASMDLDDLEETDTNQATNITKQFPGGSGRDSDSQIARDSGEPDELDTEERGLTSSNPFLIGPSSRGYAEFLVPNPPSSTPNNSTRSYSPIPISLNHNSKKTPRRRETQLTTPVPVPSYPRPAPKTKSSVPPRKIVNPAPVLKTKASVPLTKTITPVPAPSCPIPGVKRGVQEHGGTINSVPEPKPLKGSHNIKVTPVPPPPVHSIQKPRVSQKSTIDSYLKPLNPRHIQKPAEESRPVASTPIPPPVLPKAPEKLKKVSWTPVPPPTSFTSDRAAGLPNRNRFTPTGHSHKKQHTSVGAGAEVERNGQSYTLLESATPDAKTSSSRKRKLAQPEEDQEWEVKGLEDDKVLETGGELVRFFKVRWKGTWPADQNPTWEPEDNISQVLVKNYLKNKAAKTARDSLTRKKTKIGASTFKRKYSSVAEAFEGDVDVVPGPSGSLLGNLQVNDDDENDEDYEYNEEEDDDMEELFQVTEQTRADMPLRKPRVDPEPLKELAESFW
ncbi:hypothetical protein F5Y12DRAFT_713033 [Xylaria sp. FL1777]|nr:hypothetical protein F5Y12DRAFT_713033 [Xylaria sp. FL1777]